MGPDESFAMQHRARRAAMLADLFRERAQDERAGDIDVNLFVAVAGLSEQVWINAADEITRRTGKTFKPPSDVTKAICIGLLSMPATRGLVH